MGFYYARGLFKATPGHIYRHYSAYHDSRVALENTVWTADDGHLVNTGGDAQ